LGSVVFDGPVARLHGLLGPSPSAVSGLEQVISAKIRYPVSHAIEGVSGYVVILRYRDTGDKNRVIAMLFELDLLSGEVTQLCKFDSNAQPSTPTDKFRVGEFTFEGGEISTMWENCTPLKTCVDSHVKLTPRASVLRANQQAKILPN
jgi:hypothetical protein